MNRDVVSLLTILLAGCSFNEPVGGHDTPSVIGSAQWARSFGGSGYDRAMAVAIDDDGSVVAGGHLGSSPSQGFITKLDALDGSTAWTLFTEGDLVTAMGASASAEVMDLSIDASGAIVATGPYYGPVHFGGLVTAGDSGTWILKLSPDGYPIWLRTIDAEGWGSLAVDEAGRAYVAGYFGGTVDFGGGPVTTDRQDQDLYLVCVSSDGDVLWGLTAGGPHHQGLSDVALDPSGAVILAGTFTGPLDIGGIHMEQSAETNGFVVAFGRDGDLRWARNLGGGAGGHVWPSALVVRDDGGVTLAGMFIGDTDLGHVEPFEENALFLLDLSPTGETLRVTTRLGGEPHPNSMVATEHGVIIGGHFGAEHADFAGVDLEGRAMFLAAFDENGAPIDAFAYGSRKSVGADIIRAIDRLPSGELVAVGEFYESIDVGSGALPSEGDSDALVFKVATAAGEIP